MPERSRGEKRQDVLDSPELAAYVEALWPRLAEFARLAATVPPEAPGSIEWYGRIGKFWWLARERQGLTREEVAQRMSEDIDSVRFLEFGLGWSELGITTGDNKIDPSAVADSDMVKGYAQALGQPQLYEQFCERFQLIPSTSTQPDKQ